MSARYWLSAPAPAGVAAIDLFRLGQGEGRVLFAPRGGDPVAGLGEAEVLTARGPDRFDRLSQAARDCLARLVPADPDADERDAPLLLGGFSFAPDWRPAATSPWSGFEPARLVLPHVTFVGGARPRLVAVAPSGLDRAAALHYLEGTLATTGTRATDGVRPRHLTLGPSVKCRGLTPSSYERQVSDALDAIEAGDLTKVTVARSETWRTGEQIRPEELLDRLSARFPDCFVFCVEPAGGAAFVGASPERLVAVRGGVVEADALAGTVARAEDDDDDDELARALSDSDKEQREHRVVVDYLRTSLAPVVESVDHPAQPGLLRLANVQHLHTPVQGRLLNGEGAIDLAGLVHPTPAVCGLPRERAQGWLERREELDRGWYAGGVGVVSRDGDGEFCVAIRSGLLRDDVAVLFAGAGIVAGSRPESEADEVDHKLRGMREVLFDAVA